MMLAVSKPDEIAMADRRPAGATARPQPADATAGAQPRPRRVSRQKEAGEVTRRESRRRLLAAAKAEFAERGYAAATVIRIAERADVSVQTLYSNWGNKRNLLRAFMESSVTAADDVPIEPGRPPAILFATLDPEQARDPRRLLAHLSHQYRLLAERAAVGWQTYRDGAAIDPDIAADWRQINDLRRQAFHAMITRIPAGALRPGLTPAAAADTAWVIASPDTYDQLVRHAGYSYDQLEEWVLTTVSAALLG
jgi:AcrR family transcriptional regulator